MISIGRNIMVLEKDMAQVAAAIAKNDEKKDDEYAEIEAEIDELCARVEELEHEITK